MFRTRTVEVQFSATGWIEREVRIGVLASDDYAIETAREEIEAEREDVGSFRRGRVV